MRYLTPVSAAAAAALLIVSVASAQQATIVVDTATVRADDLSLTIHLEADTDIAGTQNDLFFEPPTLVLSRANGRPDCEENDDIGKPGTSFAFVPAGCTPGESCTGLRALVLSLETVDPIPTGSVIYTCRLAAEAPPGRYALGCANPMTSNPEGSVVPSTCVDGTIEVTASTVLTARTDHVRRGETGRIEVVAHSTEGATSVETDLTVATLPLRGVSTPACVAADGVDATFAFLPAGCTPGDDCTGLHASAQSAAGGPLLSGAVLFTCGVDVPLTAELGEYAVALSGASAVTGAGGVASMSVVDGAVVVFGDAQTPTVAETPEPEKTPTPALSRIEIGSASGAPGSRVQIAATIRTNEIISGVQNDLHFEPQAAIAVRAGGVPDCAPDPTLDWAIANFSFQPPACVAGLDCTGIRALLLTAERGATIASGTVLYTCNVAIDPGANGVAALTCDNAGGTTPGGQPLDVTCSGGHIAVVAPASPVPTGTALPPSPATATPTLARGSSMGSTSSGGGSCAIDPAAGGAWALLAPLALWWFRRKPNRGSRG